jgi:tRNA-Thr(GGU) m(6)t(6)A37 methyltransferase TsaA
MKEIIYKPIGIIHSPFKQAKGTPIQSAAARDIEGIIEIYSKYSRGLLDLEGFSHIILLFHCHLIKNYHLHIKPYLDTVEHGLFATRAPARPNPIGLSIVKLTKVEKAKLFISGIDVIDQTPLLDIKPYVPDFDHREIFKIGWLENKIKKLPETKDDNRFINT